MSCAPFSVDASCNTGCTNCGAGNNCLSCLTGYYLTSSSCSKCSTTCTSCAVSNNNCILCADGYYKQTDSSPCTQCGSGCNGCSLGVKCSGCDKGKYMDGDSCLSCNSYCQECTSNRECQVCKSGYYKDGSKCEYGSAPSTWSKIAIYVYVFGACFIMVGYWLISICVKAITKRKELQKKKKEEEEAKQKEREKEREREREREEEERHRNIDNSRGLFSELGNRNNGRQRGRNQRLERANERSPDSNIRLFDELVPPTRNNPFHHQTENDNSQYPLPPAFTDNQLGPIGRETRNTGINQPNTRTNNNVMSFHQNAEQDRILPPGFLQRNVPSPALGSNEPQPYAPPPHLYHPSKPSDAGPQPLEYIDDMNKKNNKTDPVYQAGLAYPSEPPKMNRIYLNNEHNK